jgi:hypothetical protein
MAYRDPEKSGLVTILHPWESGLDNSPIWDEPLSRIQVKEEDLPKFERLDIIAVEGAAETRTSQWMYDRFIYLIQLMRGYKYDEKKMYENMPFKIKDIVFSSIFYVANKFLAKIADIIDEKDTQEIKRWISRTEQNFYTYFFPFHHQQQQQQKSGRVGSNEESLFIIMILSKKIG